jgi:hypothetical protein
MHAYFEKQTRVLAADFPAAKAMLSKEWAAALDIGAVPRAAALVCAARAVLNTLGFDHEKLTYRFQGRDLRLTDVHGELVKGILA